MVLPQSKYYMKCFKSEYFRLLFHLLKCYQNHNLKFNHVIKIITGTIFDTNFLKFIVLHFYIVSTTIRFSDWHNDKK